MKKYLLLILLTAVFISCNKNDNPAAPDQNIKGIYSADFETIWKNYDKYYVFFGHKKIDWTAVYTTFSPQVTKIKNGLITALLFWGSVNFGLYASSNFFSLATVFVDYACSVTAMTISGAIAGLLLGRGKIKQNG